MKVLEFQQQQPEFKTPIWDYVDGLVDEERVADGKAAMAKNARALAHAEETYGVSRYMVAAIWGVELNFGTEMGKRPLVQSLSTLACFGERAGYFRSELMATLKIIDRGDIPADKLAGSWAGAFGQTQFMPSSYLRLAAPGSDGRRDIVDSADDALASTAHYFVKSGWRSGVPWGFEVKLPPGYSGPSGRKAKQPMSAWAARGIARIDGRPLGEGEAGLLLPAGPNGPAFLVTQEFRRRLFLQRRRILFARRLRARRSPRGRPRHPDALADRRPGPVARRPARTAGAAREARLRRRSAGRGDRNQDQGGDRRFPGEEGHAGQRAGVAEGAGGAEEVTPHPNPLP